jgi:hypothetical protein
MKAQQPQSVGAIELVRLGRTEWRVSDASDPARLLGYIERQRGDRFEVVWMTDPMRWGYAASFDDAVVAFADSLRFIGEVFEQRAPVVGRATSRSRARRATWLKASGHSSVA